ncbi:hypothetical protein [Azotobacter chroococcum]|uniref:Alpha/beta hydrolase n=1 Tax=Azotobacter chroococcum TaxID=353 RepID=A0AAP9YFR6_9GAMM|nr:hypothetical protein [Azotobacter chroococcum]QQE90500.1 hypothetical protein GKQ51_09605 [Azotobacter chroococcum]
MSNKEQDRSAEYKVIFPYFDFDFYTDKYGVIESFGDLDPVDHYIKVGAAKGYDPCRFFSTKFYAGSYPDVVGAGMNPFVHYVLFGFNEGRLARPPEAVNNIFQSIDQDDRDLAFKKWELPCILNDQKIEQAGGADAVMALLNDTSATATILRRGSKDWLIVFAGRTESFFFLKKMRGFWGNVLFLRDKSNSYYSNNPNLPVVSRFSEYIDYFTGPRFGKTILMGQSYGGHSALYQSAHIKECITFAFSPQAYCPEKYNHGVFFEKGIPKVIPGPHAPDLLEHIKQADPAPRYAIAGISESSHDDVFYWGDAIGAGLLAGTGKVSAIIVNRNEHSTARYLDAEKFFSLLAENYETFYSDTETGARLFVTGGVYYPRTKEPSA